VQLGNDGAHLVPGQDDRETLRAPGPDHVVEPGQVLGRTCR
jgi:hypothetical protein